MQATRRLALVAAVLLGMTVRVPLGGAAPPGTAPSAASSSAASEGAASRAVARFEEAEQARAEGRFAEAVRAYREALAAEPSARFAPVARARAEDLEAHAEGGFAPLLALTSARRALGSAAEPEARAAVEALARDLRGFPEGRVRAEAAVLVGEAWWRKLGDPRRAVEVLTFAAEDAAGDPLTRQLALTEASALLRERGEISAALALLERHAALSPGALAEVRRLARRGALRTASIAVLASLVVVFVFAFFGAARRLGGMRFAQRAAVRPLMVGFSLYLGGAAAVIVRLRGEGDPRPFLWLGLGVLAVSIVARTLALTSTRGRAALTAARVAVCVAGVLAAAFLSVERTDASYLASLGL